MSRLVWTTLTISIFCFFSSAAFASQGRLKPFAELDLFLPGNVSDGEEADVRSWEPQSYSIKTYAAIGGRVGILYSARDLADLGLSVGYIPGPNSEIKSTFVSGPPYNYDYTRELRIIRILAEFRKEIPGGEKWFFRPGVGIGMALGTATRSFSSGGGDSYDVQKWSGITWELSAGLAYRMSSADLNFAVRYAGFPTAPAKEISNSNDFPKIDWSTIGFSIGLSFGGNSDRQHPSSQSKARKYREDYEPRRTAPEPERDAPPSIAPVDETSDQGAPPVITDEPETAKPVGYETYIEYAEDYITAKDYAKAVGEYTNALKALEPKDPRAVFVLERKGMCFTRLKNYARAKGSCASSIKTAKALGLNNTVVVNAYSGLAYALEKGGNVPSAVKNYEKALELSKNPATKAKIRKILQRLSGQ